jgi:hypothetical protein
VRQAYFDRGAVGRWRIKIGAKVVSEGCSRERWGFGPASARSLKRLVQFSRKPLSYVGCAGLRRLGRIPGREKWA